MVMHYENMVNSVGNVELQKKEKGDSFPHTASRSIVVCRQILGENSGPSLHHVSWIDLEAVDDLLGPADYSVSESWPSLDCFQENCCRHQHTLEKHSVSHNIARGRHAMRHHCGKKRKKRHSHSEPICLE